jgi:hypothetical protein
MISRAISKLKEKGFRWFIWRLKQEARNPTSPLVQKVLDKLLRMRKDLSKIWGKSREEDILYVICDLDINPISFEVARFLVDAECEAKERGKNGFVLVFVPRSNDPLLTYEEYDSEVDADSKQWRFQNLVVPVTFLSKMCKGVYLLPQRSEAIEFVKGRDVYPDLYDGVNLRPLDFKQFFDKLDRPNMFEGLRAPIQGLKYIQTWMSENRIKNPIVTITIRNYAFDKVRNSNAEAWSRFAIYLRSEGYHPVMIPDTDAAFSEIQNFEGVTIFRECAWNMGLRMSLYESSFLNFFVPNGCSYLAVFNPRCSYIVMNCLPEGSVVVKSKESAYFLNDHDFGSSYKFATQDQRMCFETDTYENMVSAFERFVEDQKPQATIETPSSPADVRPISD